MRCSIIPSTSSLENPLVSSLPSPQYSRQRPRRRAVRDLISGEEEERVEEEEEEEEEGKARGRAWECECLGFGARRSKRKRLEVEQRMVCAAAGHDEVHTASNRKMPTATPSSAAADGLRTHCSKR